MFQAEVSTYPLLSLVHNTQSTFTEDQAHVLPTWACPQLCRRSPQKSADVCLVLSSIVRAAIQKMPVQASPVWVCLVYTGRFCTGPPAADIFSTAHILFLTNHVLQQVNKPPEFHLLTSLKFEQIVHGLHVSSHKKRFHTWGFSLHMSSPFLYISQ